MMTGRHALTGTRCVRGALIVLLLSGAAPAVAQGAAQRAPVDPYKKLFQQPNLEQAALTLRLREALRQAEAKQGPRVVCGMTLIPANPGIDPKMAVEPPARDDVRYTIRAIEPPACWIPESEREKR